MFYLKINFLFIWLDVLFPLPVYYPVSNSCTITITVLVTLIIIILNLYVDIFDIFG